MKEMTDFLFFTSIAAESVAALAVAFSIRFPGRRIWPPDSSSSWKTYLMGILFLYPAIGIGILGMMDWGSLDFPFWARIGAGGPLLLAGWALFLWAAAVLGFGPMFGMVGSLAVSGPFRISRNPQYVGCMFMLAGWFILCASPLAAVAALFGFPPLLLVPFAEEPWLKERFGGMYEAYFRQVDRFISL
jgi:protein-S-isoprenylcysteine O-methyltransferase Ste14